ncbi:unnamed protein product [Mesocestoides corti]|uniref:DNA polymerase delta catalytic subunit n=1 Tax=Mesocestoides corti TaxID=53468 RepID=A0A0R3U9G7_MESCO|nr:unnamed protein product [Mesocestoides corti]
MPLNRDDDYPNHSKRYRPEADNEEEVGASTFAQELMMVASDETSDADDDDDGGDDSTWSRPALPPVNAANDKILFQLFHLDFYEGDRLLEMPGPERSPVPIIRIYGATESGNSVVAHVHGFAPYFYASAPPSLTPEHLEKFRRALNLALHRELREDGTRGLQYLVVAVALEEKETIVGFHNQVKSKFIRITLALPKFVPTARRLLEGGFIFSAAQTHSYAVFEANVDFVTRFMVDADLTGGSWIELPATKYLVRRLPPSRKTTCQLEVDVAYNDVSTHATSGEWSKIAPIRVLSFDILCASQNGDSPIPEHDAVIQIASVVKNYGESRPFIRNVFTLGSCIPVFGSDVICCATEAEMLKKWASFVRKTDPDLITGYGIHKFDLPYLVDRCTHLGISSSLCLGRVIGSASILGENRAVSIDGRIQYDLSKVVLRDHRLRSYTLNAVSFHFLQEQTEYIPPRAVTDLQNGDDRTRRRLAAYCLKNAHLPLRIFDKLQSFVNDVEMSRITGVRFTDLLEQGPQAKIFSQLLRIARASGFVVPTVKSNGRDEYTGATVFEPVCGFYDEPIITLDFSSFYPSIIIAHNLCYTTLLAPTPTSAHTDAASLLSAHNLSPDDCTRTPAGCYFVKKHIHEGLLPRLLRELLAARQTAKRELAVETDPFKRRILDSRQLALKTCANFVYGFTGSHPGVLPCPQIASSVTGFGREMLESTKRWVEETVTVANGRQHNAEVIYGDTDCVMCRFGVSTVGEAIDVGRLAAELISGTFLDPVKLEFRKVYFPFLLLSKKHYAGLAFTTPDKHDELDCKGIETVQRDSPPLVANVVNACLTQIIINRDTQAALDQAQRAISDLLANRVDIAQLIINKKLTRPVESYCNKLPHVEVVRRMLRRNADSVPQPGDRVSYVITAGRGRNTALHVRAEDPIYAIQHQVPINTEYYLERQLVPALVRLFEPILGEAGANSAFSSESSRGVGGHFRWRVVYQAELGRLRSLEARFARLWVQCQRCQGSLHEDVVCTCADCPVFLMRSQVQIDLDEHVDRVQRFGDPSW